ncbi:surface-adhesin E family protein [Klebsiella aerogenes]|uniref:surface-adhesin E family protein n=1 Tax=Klebsiella aerogenes TaxID=548 RepID=UPI001F307018|nr:surface-adhesin E family protein [Klebsiella aerogenes]
MKRSFLVTLFSALLSFAVYASKSVPPTYPYIKNGWIYIEHDISIQKPESKGDRVTTWMKVQKGNGSYSMQKIYVNCPEYQIAGIKSKIYSEDGSLLSSWVNPAPKPNYIQPDTIGELIHSAVCSD